MSRSSDDTEPRVDAEPRGGTAPRLDAEPREDGLEARSASATSVQSDAAQDEADDRAAAIGEPGSVPR